MGCNSSQEVRILAQGEQADPSCLARLLSRLGWLQRHQSTINAKKLEVSVAAYKLRLKQLRIKQDAQLLSKRQTDEAGTFLQQLQLQVHGHRFNVEVGEKLLQQVNLARTEPRSFISEIKAQLPLFEVGGKVLALPDRRVLTNDGKGQWLQTIDFLGLQQNKPPLPTLALNECLCRCAFEHILDVKDDRFGHNSRDGSTAFQRINRFVKYKGLAGENLNQGCSDPRRIVMEMLIDDGLRSRRDRLSIFEREYQQAGMYEVEGFCCMVFITGVKQQS